MAKSSDDGDARHPGGPDVGYGMFGFSAQTVRELQVMCPQEQFAERYERGSVAPDDVGGLMVTGMSAVRELTRNRNVDGLSSLPPAHTVPMIPLEIDGPLHTVFRRLLNPLFSPGAVARLEPDVREITDELVDTFVADGRADVYSGFCELLPAKAFLRFMGFPESGLGECLDYKETVIRHSTEESAAVATARKVAAADRFDAYFRELLDARRRSDSRPDDLMSALLELRVDDELLDDDTLVSIVEILIIGGFDTTASSLSLDLLWLAQHPDERRRLVANPDGWINAVEELLRIEAIVPIGHRQPREDVVVDGQHVPSGTSLNVLWASANLDPEVFPDPLTVNLEREPNPHVSFAAGIHHCLGAHLARMELAVSLDQFHRRIPEYTLDPDVELQFESVPIRMVKPVPLVWQT